MARTRQEPLTRDQVENALAADENLAQLAAVIDSLTGDEQTYEVHVYKMPEGLRKSWAYLYRVPLENFNIGESLDSLREKEGGGDYRFQIRRANGQLVKNTEFSIAAPKKVDAAAASSPDKLLELQRENSDRSRSDMMALLGMMQTSSQQMMQFQMQSSQMTMQMITTLMSSLIPAMAGNKGPDIASIMGAFAQLQASIQKPGGNLNEQLETFVKIKELIGDGGAGGDDSVFGNLSKMASALGPAFVAALENKGEPPKPDGAAKPQARMIARPVPHERLPEHEAPNPAPQVSANAADPMMQSIQSLIIKAAHAGKDPAPYAEMLLDQLPEDDDFLGTLLDTLEKENWKEEISPFVPALLEIPPEWALALRDEIIALLTGEPEPVETPSPATASESELPATSP